MKPLRRWIGWILVALTAVALVGVLVLWSLRPHPIPFEGGAAPAGEMAGASALGPTSVSPRLGAEALRASARGANVVICVMDAARADRFGAYGYPRETTPNFDRLAREGVLFQQHFCQYPQTSPSTATLFTGQYPDTHGVAVPRTGQRHERLRGLPYGQFTLDGAMSSAGFHTLLFTSTPASAPVLGLGSSCEVVFTPLGNVHSPQENTLWHSPEHLMGFVRANLTPERRFYAYVHFLPPHEPYEVPGNLKDLFAGKKAPGYFEAAPAFTRVYARFHDQDPPATGSDWGDLYDANLRWSDWGLGELVAHLKRIGAYDNTLLIVTADHGEALGEHRYQWHATCPYDEAIYIPLLIKFPGGKGPTGRVAALTETVDIMPTILDLVGVSRPESALQGESLLPLLTGERKEIHDYVFCRTNGRYPCYVVRDHRWALLLYQGGTMRALYDLRADPRQTHNIIAEEPQQAARLVGAFVRFARSQPFRPLDFVDPRFKPLLSPEWANTEIPKEAREQLRSLGYLE